MAKKKHTAADYLWGSTRISLGLIFLWAFFDKLFGLGFTTCRNPETSGIDVLCDKAWLEGGEPTTGFLKFGTDGPFADFYQGLAGNALVDWLFMLGLLGLGVALVFGIGMKIASWAGTLLMLMMWSAALPPEHHPFLDDHIIYALVLLGLWQVNDRQTLGIGEQWRKTELVKKYPVLE